MSRLNHYLVGNQVVMLGSCGVLDPLNPDADPTPTDATTVTYTRVDTAGAVHVYTTGDPEVTHLATGVYACTVLVSPAAGREKWRFVSSGACAAAAEDEFDVLPSAVV